MRPNNGFTLLTTLPDFPKEILFEGIPTAKQLEVVEEIAQSASNTREGIVNGLEGVGNIMSLYAGVDGANLDPHDVFTVGWLIATLSPLLEGINSTEEDARMILQRCANPAENMIGPTRTR